MHRTVQLIVFAPEMMTAVVPGMQCIAGDVVQLPTRPGLHTRLMDHVAKHVVVIAHDNPVIGVDHLALIAFDVQLDAGGILLVNDSSVPLKSVVLQSKEGTAQCVKISRGRRVGMSGCSVV